MALCHLILTPLNTLWKNLNQQHTFEEWCARRTEAVGPAKASRHLLKYVTSLQQIEKQEE